MVGQASAAYALALLQGNIPALTGIALRIGRARVARST